MQSWHIYASLFVVFCTLYLKKIYKYITHKMELRRTYNSIVGPKSHWLKGHLDHLSPDEKGVLAQISRMKDFPKVEVQHYGPLYSMICCYFPTIVKPLLSFDCNKEYWSRRFLLPWLGKGLFLSHGEKWQRNRKLLTPAFHFDILKNYVQVFNESVEIMESKLRQSEEPVDVFEPVSLMTFDSMLRCMMSYESDCQTLGQLHPYVKAVHDLSEGVIKRFFAQPFSRSDLLFNMTAAGKKFNAALKIAHHQTTTVIQNRIKTLKSEKNSENENKRRLDFLDIILLAKDENGKGLTESEIVDEASTFLFAGSDTTASGISWILYDLATNLEHQDKCRKEVNEILGDRDHVEWEDLSRFNYLTMCIKESMRLHPPAPYLGRCVNRPVRFENDFGEDQLTTTSNKTVNSAQEFPTDTNFNISILSLHHNPHLWKNAETFDPLRFTKENFSKQPNFSYIPFSAGPRNCIGQNFAMMEIKISIAKCLKHFEIYVDKDCPKPHLITTVLLRSDNGIMLKFKNLS